MSAVRRVAVVGRDAAAWLTALALHRAFGRAGVVVEVVELPTLLTPADAYVAVPSLSGLHRLLGLDDARVLAACAGAPVLGQRFVGWSGNGSGFVHGYDAQQVAISEIDFLQFWVKARGEGMKVAWEDFSLAAVAARQGRMPLAAGDGATGAPALSAGFHLDAPAYVNVLRAHALRAGVVARSTRGVAVEREGERVLRVRLDDGSMIEGDLFIDASGPEAALSGGQPGADFRPWTGFLADRVLTASTAPLRPLPGYSQVEAFAEGWTGLYPLRDRTAVTAVYQSSRCSDEQMAARLTNLVGRPIDGTATVSACVPGARAPWTGNCVAVGEAAAVLEPLDALHLHVVHMGLSNLIALFPVAADRMPEAEAYNRGMASHLANVRDFQLAHYRLNRREGEPFWDDARAGATAPRLDHKLDTFAARGQVPLYDDESFQTQNWASIFVGHNEVPRDYDPLVDTIPEEEQMARFRALLSMIADEVRAMPSVEDAVRAGAA